MIRTLTAAALLLLAAWLLWQGVSGVAMIVGRGSPLGDALMQPPTSLWRIVAASLALIGAGLAALKVRGGGWLALTGALLFAAMAGTMAAMGITSRMWMDEAIAGGLMIALAIGLITLPRRVERD
jgi:hypothetical protein